MRACVRACECVYVYVCVCVHVCVHVGHCRTWTHPASMHLIRAHPLAPQGAHAYTLLTTHSLLDWRSTPLLMMRTPHPKLVHGSSHPAHGKTIHMQHNWYQGILREEQPLVTPAKCFSQYWIQTQKVKIPPLPRPPLRRFSTPSIDGQSTPSR